MSTITCDNCGTEIEVSAALEPRVREDLRKQVEADMGPARKKIEEEQRAVADERRKLEADRKGIDEQVRERLAEAQAKIEADAQAKAKAAVAVELKDQQAQMAELRDKVKQMETNELDLRKRERALKEQAEAMELEVTRKLDEERDKIRTQTRKQVDEEHDLKLREKDQKIDGLLRQVQDMQRKIEQGSMQTQGEVMEQAMEERLRNLFSMDDIEEVSKGKNGADVRHRVLTPGGVQAGTILWEFKRTKNWSQAWLKKLREDAREANADVAVIVTAALPPDVDRFELIEDVWVCSTCCMAGLAMSLRAGMLEAAKSRLALKGQNGKMEQVYNYLTSPEFRHRITAMVEAFATMQDDLAKEKRVITRQWAKREKQIEQALSGMTGMYGDLQGIIGNTLPEVDGMGLGLLEADE